MKTAIFIPTFRRPEALQRVVEDIAGATPEGQYAIYFIVEKDDTPTINMLDVLNQKVIVNKHEPCYAGAINTAYEETTEPLFFTGADDLDFHQGWLESACSYIKDGIFVIGTNDLGSIPIGPERDSTHYLISREYILTQSGRIDKPNTVLYPYQHNYTDKEFIETAKKRGVYKFVPESEVEHMHWAWGKAQMDDTYRKGFASASQDEQRYKERQPLWENL